MCRGHRRRQSPADDGGFGRARYGPPRPQRSAALPRPHRIAPGRNDDADEHLRVDAATDAVHGAVCIDGDRRIDADALQVLHERAPRRCIVGSGSRQQPFRGEDRTVISAPSHLWFTHVRHVPRALGHPQDEVVHRGRPETLPHATDLPYELGAQRNRVADEILEPEPLRGPVRLADGRVGAGVDLVHVYDIHVIRPVDRCGDRGQRSG